MDWYPIGLAHGQADRDLAGGETILDAAAQYSILEAWLVSDPARKAALLELDAGNLDGADACPLVRELDSPRGRAFTDAWAGYLTGWPEAGR